MCRLYVYSSAASRVTNDDNITELCTLLQVLDGTAGVSVVHVAVDVELHHRARSGDARWSLCFVLLGV